MAKMFTSSSEEWNLITSSSEETSLIIPDIENITIFEDTFVGNPYDTFIIKDPNKGHIVYSVMLENSESYAVMLFTDSTEKFLHVPSDRLDTRTCRGVNLASAIKEYDSSVFRNRAVEVASKQVEEILKTMESTKNIMTYKFGLMYVRQGMQLEEDVFGLCETSEEYDEFLRLLGDRVRLKDFDRYRGGLDIKYDSTGTHSIFTLLNETEIMFHVNHLLPFDEDDTQQISRKRHIGNDVIVIFFIDEGTLYDPETILTKQNHILFGVQKVENGYKIEIATKSCVDNFHPIIPEIIPPEQLREYLLTLCCLAERAASSSGPFLERITMYRQHKLELIYNEWR